MRSTPSSAPAAAKVMNVIGRSGSTSRTVPTMARTSSTVTEPSAARSLAPPRLARPTDTSTRSTSGVMFRSVHGLPSEATIGGGGSVSGPRTGTSIR
jgi:hypothetical protein